MSADPSTAALPPLREDLQLVEGAAGEDGGPTWLIYDPPRHRYFRIGWLAYRLIALWRAGDSSKALTARARSQGLPADSDTVDDLVGFLATNHLVRGDASAAVQAFAQARRQGQRGWLAWLVHNYLFIRIPLFRPDAFLARTLPVADVFFSRPFRLLTLLLGVLGVLLVGRDWDRFSSTFLHFLSLDGLLCYALSLAFVKSAHELGHAYTAKRQGCRVGSIGVAFLVLFPVLYTDTTDAWRLRGRRERLAIGAAGVMTELHLALIATFLWAFLPDGPLASAAFFVATTSWVTSLAVNSSPFMRFDGYYLLMDLLGADNLQPRSFAMARWRLRELLFGLGEPAPEPMPAWRRRTFVLYAWMTWTYRFVLFVGIAILVYVFTFKALGIVLFAVEILWFIVLPIARELREWHRRRAGLRWNRQTVRLLALLALGGAAILLPWRSTLPLPAVLEADRFVQIFPPSPAVVSAILVEPGQRVAAGDVLARMGSERLAFEAAQHERKIALVTHRIERSAGSRGDLEQRLVLEQSLAELRSALAGVRTQQARLHLRAPFDGIVVEIADLQVGQWLGPTDPVMNLRGLAALRISALVDEGDVSRVAPGARGRFLADGAVVRPVEARVVEVDLTAVQILPYPALAVPHGGPIDVRPLPDGRLRPERALYRVSLAPIWSGGVDRQVPGIVHVEGPARSWLAEGLRRVAAVLVRESGF